MIQEGQASWKVLDRIWEGYFENKVLLGLWDDNSEKNYEHILLKEVVKNGSLGLLEKVVQKSLWGFEYILQNKNCTSEMRVHVFSKLYKTPDYKLNESIKTALQT
jgi:hypothetical protein